MTAATPTASEDFVGRAMTFVAANDGISVENLLSPNRTRRVVEAGRKAMYLAYRISGKSLPEVGRRFGGRDHTTVLHAVRTTETRADADPGFQAELLHLARRIDSHGRVMIALSEVRMPRYRAG